MSQPSKKLLEEWNKKLADSGFKDIEQEDGNLKTWDSFRFQAKYDVLSFGAKEEYYRQAGVFAHSHPFESDQERIIWTMHAEGATHLEIYKTLRKRRKGMYERGIRKVINRLAALMSKSDV